MPAQIHLSRNMLRQVEASLGGAVARHWREPRGNNDNKYLAEVSGRHGLHVISIWNYRDTNDRQLLVDRIGYFGTLCRVINEADARPRNVYPFPEFTNFTVDGVRRPFVDVSDNGSQFLIAINRFVWNANGTTENIHETIRNGQRQMTTGLALRAGEFLGTIHSYSRRYAEILPKRPAADLLDAVSSQLETHEADIIEHNGPGVHRCFRSEYDKLTSSADIIRASARKNAYWCLLDYYPVNTIESQKGLCFVDFGSAEVADPLQDLAMSIDAWCTEENVPSLILAKHFLAGYRKHLDLPKDESGLLYELIRLSILRWGVNRAVNRTKRDRLSQTSDPTANVEKLLNWRECKPQFQAMLRGVL